MSAAPHKRRRITGKRRPVFRLKLATPGGELATVDAEPAWQIQDVLVRLPDPFREFGYGVNVYNGTQELCGQRTLSDIGTSDEAVLTIVRSKLPLILTASIDGSAKIWSAAAGQCLQTFAGHDGVVRSAVFSPDCDRILTASNGSAKIWSAATGQCLQTFPRQGAEVLSAVFSPTCDRILTDSMDGSVKIWSVASGQCLQTFAGHYGAVSSAVFSPDCDRVLTASRDGSARIWSVASGQCLQTFTGHGDCFVSAVFSPTCDRVLTASFHGSAKIWSAAGGQCMQTFTHGRYMTSAVFSQQE